MAEPGEITILITEVWRPQLYRLNIQEEELKEVSISQASTEYAAIDLCL